jgi:hypothetical protein
LTEIVAQSLQQISFSNIEVLSVPAPLPNRINEDAWLALQTTEPPGYVIVAVIDGAGGRLTLPPLQARLDRERRGLSPAAFAATWVQNSLVAQFNSDPGRSLPEALLTANETLRAMIADTIGDFSAENILAMAGLPADSDPRRMRLALPACVVTLIRLDCTHQQLEFAHAGDTCLLEVRRSGEAISHATDQMGPYDENALKLAAQLQQARGIRHLAEAVWLFEVQQLNLENGLRHNYVDEQGRTWPGAGCGVINGLPELADYLEVGTIPVDPDQTAGFCLLSDGLQLLAPLSETSAEIATRWRQTGVIVRHRGLRGLYNTIHQMADADEHFDQYPRFKSLDDATGVYLQFSGKK